MKQQNRRKHLLAAFMFPVVLMVAIGCRSKDYSDGTEPGAISTGTTDTSMNGMATPSTTTDMPASSATDTAAAVNSSTTNMAKPDPAKKGMKGRVSITEPARSTGNLEPHAMGIYNHVEMQASFPGGARALQNYFDRNVSYPEDANTEGVDGVVNVSFIVDEKGNVTKPAVVGSRMGYGLEDEALRIINKMPRWTPAMVKGKAVKSRYTLPVRFELYQ